MSKVGIAYEDLHGSRVACEVSTTGRERAIEALLQCLRVLRGVPDEAFDIGQWSSSCGTVKCAAGWCASDAWFQEHRGLCLDKCVPVTRTGGAVRSIVAVADAFGLTHAEAVYLFSYYAYHDTPATLSAVVARVAHLLHVMRGHTGAGSGTIDINKWLTAHPRSTHYGAPLGALPAPPLDPDAPTWAQRVRIDGGGYAPDGTYWGLRAWGDHLYAVFQDDGHGGLTIHYTDAASPAQAKENCDVC